MKININESNKSKILAALHAVNGSASAHTVNTFAAVEIVAERAERKLKGNGLTVAQRRGAMAVYTPASPGAASYKYEVITTTVYLLRGWREWFLVDVQRSTRDPKSAECLILRVSSAQAAAISRHALQGLQIKLPTAAA